MDHKNLKYFIKAQKLNQRQARYVLYLSRFRFALKHMAGKSIGQANSLSRRVDQTEEVERNNENQVMLKKEWLEIKIMEKGQLLIEEAKEEIIKKLRSQKQRIIRQ